MFDFYMGLPHMYLKTKYTMCECVHMMCVCVCACVSAYMCMCLNVCMCVCAICMCDKVCHWLVSLWPSTSPSKWPPSLHCSGTVWPWYASFLGLSASDVLKRMGGGKVWVEDKGRQIGKDRGREKGKEKKEEGGQLSNYFVIVLINTKLFSSAKWHTHLWTSPWHCIRAASHISSQSSVMRQSSETRSWTTFTRVAFCCLRESMITERDFSRFVSSTRDVSAGDRERNWEGEEGKCEKRRGKKKWRNTGMEKLKHTQLQTIPPWTAYCAVNLSRGGLTLPILIIRCIRWGKLISNEVTAANIKSILILSPFSLLR